MRTRRRRGRAHGGRGVVTTAMVMLATIFGLLGASRAHAQQRCTPDMTEQQKKDSLVAWWQQATERYQQERYQESIEAFQHAYDCAMLQPPSDKVTMTTANSVFNIAQAHRQLGACRTAIQGYRRYLRMTATLARDKQVRDVRDGVVVTLGELERDCPASAEEEPQAEATSRPDQTEGSDLDTSLRTDLDTGERTTTALPATDPIEPGATRERRAVHRRPRSDGDGDGDGAASGSPLVSVSIAVGPAFLDMGRLEEKPQSSFGLRAGHPMQLGLLDLELGVAATYTLAEWDHQDVKGTAALWSILLNAGVSRPLMGSRLSPRIDFGLGILNFGRLGMHNPFTVDGVSSQPLTMLHTRVELGVVYAITPKLVLSVSPLVLAYSVPHEDLNDLVTRLTRYEMLFGAGFRM